MMTIRELEQSRAAYVSAHYPYKMCYWGDYDYKILNNIMYKKKRGRNNQYWDKKTYNDCIIMADTETSRLPGKQVPILNIIVAWTISLRAMGFNWVTLWGRKPSEFIEALKRILAELGGDRTFIFFHNLSYDYVFLRKFLFKAFGTPTKQLNTKPHYPISIEFENGLIIKDSLILAQVKLEKWAADLGVEHQKAVGKWDYEKLRGQNEQFTPEELEYIEHDTLAGVECLDKMMSALDCNISSLPYTATGILRAQIRKIGEDNKARDRYLRQVLDYEQYKKCTKVFHGGYCHGNRDYLNVPIYEQVTCYDETSAYPFVMLAFRYPCEKFMKLDGPMDPKKIMETSERYAYMFRLDLVNVRLKDPNYPMPVLSYAKASKEFCINPITDNGRILAADFLSVYCNEQDLWLYSYIYDWDMAACNEVEAAAKRYLPRWFTDLIFDLFKAKQMLKGGDKVQYALAKAKINSAYGCSVQRNITPDIIEDYISGEFTEECKEPEKKYNEYINKRGAILPYQWGTWVCSYAQRQLFLLSECIDKEHGGTWLYSDTDSIYATKWNEGMIDAFNRLCEKMLNDNGYGAVEVNGKKYCLGTVTCDGKYKEFKTLGAKRYCGRSEEDNELHITISGVPKKGAICLKDNIHNFKPGFIFKGEQTGKLTHFYIFTDDIKEEPYEIGDSIDLRPCDYELDIGIVDWEKFAEKEIRIQVYEEE